jgi:putative restriction endonuclease
MPSPSSFQVDPEMPIRLAAFKRLEELTRHHGPVLNWDVLKEGFSFRGETYLFATQAKGIFRPKHMRGAALSIKTTIPRGNREARYDDNAEDAERGIFIYRFQGQDPENRDNQLLEQAYRQQTPLLYLLGIEPARYQPIWPVFIADFDKQALTCRVVADDPAWVETSLPALHDGKADLIRRQYVTVQAKKRLHQALFRVEVLRAYETRCAVCHLPHEPLLHAAHIRPDSDELGEATVRNGLALCLLHHGAFDADLLGIRPDGQVELSPAMSELRQPSIIQCAFRAFEGRSILKPPRRDDWPSEEFLEERYQRFREQAA